MKDNKESVDVLNKNIFLEYMFVCTLVPEKIVSVSENENSVVTDKKIDCVNLFPTNLGR